MSTMKNLFALLALAGALDAAPLANATEADSIKGPVPGYSDTYVNYTGKSAPYPANMSGPILPTASGPPGVDDLVFQNVLSAEWIIYSFYQSAIERFKPQDFVDAGYPNSTYKDLAEIRDNEAGHLRIFQDSISATSVKAGACSYTYPYNTPQEFMRLQVEIELSSMAFASGLVLQAQLNASKGALVIIGESESRHNAWAALQVWRVSPFAGPADTVYPYANQILATTNTFVVPGSCPSANPPYPNPNQNLPTLDFDNSTSNGMPGSNITFVYDPEPAFQTSKQYHAVFFHGVNNVTMPLDMSTNSSTIPDFDHTGMIIAVIADTPGAPTAESVVAGPLYLIEQPSAVTDSSPFE